MWLLQEQHTEISFLLWRSRQLGTSHLQLQYISMLPANNLTLHSQHEMICICAELNRLFQKPCDAFYAINILLRSETVNVNTSFSAAILSLQHFLEAALLQKQCWKSSSFRQDTIHNDFLQQTYKAQLTIPTSSAHVCLHYYASHVLLCVPVE